MLRSTFVIISNISSQDQIFKIRPNTLEIFWFQAGLKLDRCAVWFCCCWVAVDSDFIVSCRELHPHVLWCWISGSWLRSLNLCMKCIVLAHSVSTSFPLIKLNDSLSFLWHIPTSLHWTLWLNTKIPLHCALYDPHTICNHMNIAGSSSCALCSAGTFSNTSGECHSV